MVAQLTDELSIEPLELEDCLNSMSSPPSDPATPCAQQCAHTPPPPPPPPHAQAIWKLPVLRRAVVYHPSPKVLVLISYCRSKGFPCPLTPDLACSPGLLNCPLPSGAPTLSLQVRQFQGRHLVAPVDPANPSAPLGSVSLAEAALWACLSGGAPQSESLALACN